MQVSGDGIPTGTPPAGTGDPTPPANTGGQGDPGPATTNPPAGQQPGTGAGDGQPTDPNDVAGLKSALDKERAANRSGSATARELQKKLEAAEKRLKEIDDAQKTELDKANEAKAEAERKAAEAEAKARTTALRFEVARHAATENFADPEDPYRMLDLSKVEFDDEGVPQGIEALVKDLAKAKPYLLKPTGQQAPPPAQAPRPTPAAALTGTQTPPDVDERYKQEELRNTRNML